MDTPHDIAALARAAIDKVGGAALARHLLVSRPSVQGWKDRGIPPARVPGVAEFVGCGYHDLRPDLFPPPAVPQQDAA
jgi:DNA-binding transcriptional regulator YdaS (Cro superfamily)